MSRIRTLPLILGMALLVVPATSAPAAFENGAVDLAGSSWEGQAALKLVLRSRVGGGRESLPDANVVIDFVSPTAVTITSDSIGDVSGTWAAAKRKKRRLKGVPDEAVVAAEAEALRSVLEDFVRAEVGNAATVTIFPRKGSKLKARLNRDGTVLAAKLRYNFKGRIQIRNRSIPFRLTEKAKVDATPIER